MWCHHACAENLVSFGVVVVAGGRLQPSRVDREKFRPDGHVQTRKAALYQTMKVALLAPFWLERQPAD